uniref:Uncharacterized protein n=1 Tax=Vespula pensylvanica TaxID=30213 RepID=A0A834UAF3_VESPE|nr:hypothetical protein H0235_008074 [Vespula pensylvanica]
MGVLIFHRNGNHSFLISNGLNENYFGLGKTEEKTKEGERKSWPVQRPKRKKGRKVPDWRKSGWERPLEEVETETRNEGGLRVVNYERCLLLTYSSPLPPSIRPPTADLSDLEKSRSSDYLVDETSQEYPGSAEKFGPLVDSTETRTNDLSLAKGPFFQPNHRDSPSKPPPLPVPVVPTSVQGHYHTGTSSNRRRLMYAQFVSVFEFRIQMAHLPKSRWLSGSLKGNDVGNAVDRTRHSWNHHSKAL